MQARRNGKSKVPIPARSSAVSKYAMNTWVCQMAGIWTRLTCGVIMRQPKTSCSGSMCRWPMAAGRISASHFGMGDLILGGRGKLALGEKLSWILGTNFILDTASNEVLGSGWNQIVPLTYLVWKPSRQWILSVGYEYAASFGGSDNSELEKISESLFRPGALYHLPKGFWLWLDPKIYVNHEQGSDTTLVLEGEFGKVVTANVEVWLRGGGNVAGEAGREERLGWKAEAGLRYLFD